MSRSMKAGGGTAPSNLKLLHCNVTGSGNSVDGRLRLLVDRDQKRTSSVIIGCFCNRPLKSALTASQTQRLRYYRCVPTHFVKSGTKCTPPLRGKRRPLVLRPEIRDTRVMKIVLLAGGLGSRIAEESSLRPKPMIEIGGRPILWHIMKIYAYHGFSDFIVCLGYKGYMIKEYFMNFF